jgi:amino acid transporter
MKDSPVKLFTLIASGVGCVIGSGWLFGAERAAALAGPAAIFSWVIGALIILVVSLSIVEISTTSPIRMGSIGYYLRYTHGPFVTFLAEWTIMIGYVSTVPSEATASVQYLSSWNFDWTRSLFDVNSHSLTHTGLIVSSIICIFYFLINYYSLNFLAKSIKALTIFKIIAPFIVIASFIIVSYHSTTHYDISSHPFAPYGISGIFTAITTAGIVYSFNGFQSPVSFASEAKNPRRDVPIAIIATIIISATIYVLLQYIYISSMPADLVAKHGWNGLKFASPFADLALAINLNMVAMLLYLDAFVSPAGAGIVYNSVTARIMYGMSDHMPKIISHRNNKTGIPTGALFVLLILSFICLWLLPSWDRMAAVISVGYVLGYASSSVCAISFRKISPDKLHKNSIRIPGMKFFAPLGFILVSYMLYWSCWPLNGQVIFVVLFGLPFYVYYSIKHKNLNLKDIKNANWFLFYLAFSALFGFIGSKSFGGLGLIPDIIDHIIIAITSLIFFYWGRSSSYKTPAYFKEIEDDHQFGNS